MPLSDSDIEVPATRPKSKPARPKVSGTVTPDDPTRRSGGEKEQAAPQAPASLDEALASRQKPIGPRLQADLWALVGDRAERIGVPIRLLLADALVRVLEQSEEEHLTNVRETDQRERMAAARRPRT